MKKIFIIMLSIIMIISGCSKNELNNNQKESSLDIPKQIQASNKDASQIEEVETDVTSPNIIIEAIKEDLKIAVDNYLITEFQGNFILENLDTVTHNFTIRIPIYEDLLAKEEIISSKANAVIYSGDEEVQFSLKAGERKTIELSTLNYDFYTSHKCEPVGGFGTLEQLYIVIDNIVFLLNPEGISKQEFELDSSAHIKEIASLNNQLIKISQEQVAIVEENLVLKEAMDVMNENSDYVTSYFGQKWPKPIGLRQLSEGAEVHIFPNILSPKVDFAYPGVLVTALEYVWAVDWEDEPASKGEWFLIMTSEGQIGFVDESGLEEADISHYEWINDYKDVTESIAGCSLGNRIEKLIGTLDQDYIPAHENGRIYVFQDAAISDSSANHSPFTPGGSLDVFVGATNHIATIRTDSEAFSLDSDIGVGSTVQEVIDYYDAKYEKVEISERFGEGEVTHVIAYQIGENAELVFEFSGNISDLDSKVMYIRMQRLYRDNRFG